MPFQRTVKSSMRRLCSSMPSYEKIFKPLLLSFLTVVSIFFLMSHQRVPMPSSYPEQLPEINPSFLDQHHPLVKLYKPSDYINDLTTTSKGESLTFVQSCKLITKQGHLVQTYAPELENYHLNDFIMCLMPKGADIVSDYIREDGYWEADVSAVALKFVKKSSHSVFLDIGGNLGTHSLFMASQGCRVYTVEPMPINIVHLISSARLSNVDENLVVFANAIYSERKLITMSAPVKHNQGNFRISNTKTTNDDLQITTVLLSDIIETIIKTEASRSIDPSSHSKLQIAIKMDIEGAECDAILGSQELFEDNEDFEISVFMMEWTFADRFNKICGPEKAKHVVEVFLRNNYLPYKNDMETKLDTKEYETWSFGMIMWLKIEHN